MKTNIRNICSATLLGMLLLTASTPLFVQADEQSTTTVKSTTSVGTVSEFGPKEILIKTEASPDPIRYSYTKTTTYVDESGAPVSMEMVKSGVPVTVYYEKSGDHMVASKVIVRKSHTESTEAPAVEEKKTTTTTTTDK